MRMSYNEAVAIQARQLAYYSEISPASAPMLAEKVRSETLPCPFDPDAEVSVIEINRLVPRGCDFERWLELGDCGGD
jgi:hypothetical protein